MKQLGHEQRMQIFKEAEAVLKLKNDFYHAMPYQMTSAVENYATLVSEMSAKLKEEIQNDAQ